MAAVEIAGIKKLKIYNTGNIKMWKHPKYYKDLRKLYRSRNRDQAISLQASTEDAGRTPGTGLKLGEMDIASSKQQADKHLSSQAGGRVGPKDSS